MAVQWTPPVAVPQTSLDVIGTAFTPSFSPGGQGVFIDLGQIKQALSDFASAPTEETSLQTALEALAQSVLFQSAIRDGSQFDLLDNPADKDLGQTLGGPRFLSSFASEEIRVRASDALQRGGAYSGTNGPATDKETRCAQGLLDYSIAFLNRAFRTQNGQESRFRFLWIQDREPTDKILDLFPGQEHKVLGFGTVLLKPQIDALIRRFTRSDGFLDEQAAYAAFTRPPPGMRDAWRLRNGHGTVVADLMAGPSRADAPIPDTDLYGVELPTSVLQETSGQKLLGPMLLGLSAQTIVASRISRSVDGSKPQPLVTNASLSFTGGPDAKGSPNPLARQLGEIVNALNAIPDVDLTLTIPAGNHRQDRIFAQTSPGKTTLTWSVPPDDFTPNTLEIHTDGADTQLTGLSVKAPGLALAPVDLPALTVGSYSDLENDGTLLARLTHEADAENGRSFYALRVLPTVAYLPGDQTAPAGFWNVSVETTSGGAGLWIRRDDTLPGFPTRARQSSFVDANYETRAPNGQIAVADLPSPKGTQSPIRRESTGSVLLDAVDIAKGKIVGVAGREKVRAGAGQTYRLSGQRRNLPAHLAEATAEVSRVLGGPLSIKRLSYGTDNPGGTSMASAQAARDLAGLPPKKDPRLDERHAGHNPHRPAKS